MAAEPVNVISNKMTVRELIYVLRKCPPDSQVIIDGQSTVHVETDVNEDDVTFTYINEDVP